MLVEKDDMFDSMWNMIAGVQYFFGFKYPHRQPLINEICETMLKAMNMPDYIGKGGGGSGMITNWIDELRKANQEVTPPH